MIHKPEDFSADFEIETDVAIVGAGPGGAAAAFKLSSKGRRVAILEMGGYFSPANFSRDGLKALQNLYQDGGQRFTHGNAFFATMFGKGVGGGSLVNSAISFRPPEKAIKRWREEAALRDFSYENLKPYLEEVEKNVPIEIKNIKDLGRNNTIFKEGLEKLKLKGGVIPRNTENCVACAQCFFGCPSGAKQSVDKNFIARALEKSADLYIYAHVEAIFLDPDTRRFDSMRAVLFDPTTNLPRCRMTLKAKHLILAAGAVGSPQLLLKNRLSNSSGQVGKNFRCHPSTGVIGVFDEEINGFKSVVQGYFSDAFMDEDILLETYWAPAGILAVSLPGFGLGPTNTMKKLKHFAGSGAMIRDESSGELDFDGGRVAIKYIVNERDQKLLTKGLFKSGEVLFAAGAKVVYADNQIKSVFYSQSELRDFFAAHENLGPDIIREGNHGMGTCRMGENPKTSVVNSYGRSHDIPNLWVHDVSAFPSALGVNPQITIMTLALRGAEYLDGNFS